MSPKTAVLAIRKLLKQTALSIDEIHSLEVNEAFAVIDVLLEREFPGIRERLIHWEEPLLTVILTALPEHYPVTSVKGSGTEPGKIWHLRSSGSRRDRNGPSGGKSIKKRILRR